MKRLRPMFGLLTAAVLLVLLFPVMPAQAESQTQLTTVLFTHDLHSHFFPQRTQDGGESGGYARLIAALRTDFNIKSGFQTEDMPRIKYKSKMKEYYQKAGIATARYHMVDDLESCRKFIDEVGYPVVVKPDNGVGASDTHKLSSDEELKRFLLYKSTYHPDLSYIMEEFVHAEVNSYDAIIDGSGISSSQISKSTGKRTINWIIGHSQIVTGSICPNRLITCLSVTCTEFQITKHIQIFNKLFL